MLDPEQDDPTSRTYRAKGEPHAGERHATRFLRTLAATSIARGLAVFDGTAYAITDLGTLEHDAAARTQGHRGCSARAVSTPMLVLLFALISIAIGAWLTWFPTEPIGRDLAEFRLLFGIGFLLAGCSLIVGAAVLWLTDRE